MRSSELLHDYPRVLKTASSEQPVKSGDTRVARCIEVIPIFAAAPMVRRYALCCFGVRDRSLRRMLKRCVDENPRP